MTSQRDEWLKARRQYITATDVAAICGISPWRSPHDVWLDKRGLVETQETVAMRVGRRQQELILDLYEEQAKVPVYRYGETDLVVAKSVPWAAATPDAEVLAVERRVVEAKNVGRARQDWGDEGTDAIPDHYLVQVAWQMMVTGQELADLAAIFGGSRFAVYRVRRNAALEDALLARCERFREEHLETGIAPPISAGPGASSWLRQAFPREAHEEFVDADEKMELTAALLKDAGQRYDISKRECEVYENRIKADIGLFQGAHGRRWRATWKAIRQGEVIDWEAVAREVAAEMPEEKLLELVKVYTKKKPPQRRFHITFDEED